MPKKNKEHKKKTRKKVQKPLYSQRNFILKEVQISLDILVAGILTVVFLICISFIFFKTHQALSANFADNVMRPLIGNQATISIESFFFGIEDNINQLTSHFIKPDSQVFSDTMKKAPSFPSAFVLTPIPVDKNSLPGEGIWTPIISASSDALMAQTFIRPDSLRPYAIVALVKMNMQKLGVGAVAGTWEPGEASDRGPGMIPVSLQQSNLLVGAFNGGFQKKDGAYGMIVGNNTYLPLQKGLATLVIYGNQTPQIIDYEGEKLTGDISAIRQNGPMLIENGQIVATSTNWNMQTWGLTTTNSMYTWRSGLGVTKSGDLVYAVGPSLVPQTLALALLKAGAINAMQLDINPVWVRFVLYTSLGNGKYSYQMLLKNMTNGGMSYLTGYQKDFFYIYKKG